MRPESSDSAARTELREMVVRLVHSSEQPRYQELMREHHYLGHLPKIGETLWYVASWREQWVALLSLDRKSTRLNSSHITISYAVFCLKKKKHFFSSADSHFSYSILFDTAVTDT